MFYKFTNKECNHRNYQYKEGLNVDVHQWDDRECAAGGLHFTDRENMHYWLDFLAEPLQYVWDVEIPANALVAQYPFKYKADRIILKNRRLLNVFINEFTDAEQIKAVDYSPRLLQWIIKPRRNVIMAAINKDGRCIRYVENPDFDMQLEAVRINGEAIAFIMNPQEKIRLAAIYQNPFAIKYIDDPLDFEKILAVRRNGESIEYIKNPDKDIQLAAVQNTIKALKCITRVHPDVIAFVSMI